MEITIQLPENILDLPTSEQSSAIGLAIGEALEELADIEAYDQAKQECLQSQSGPISLDEWLVDHQA